MMQHCDWCEPDEDDDEPMLTVQVPVSLVERAADLLDKHYPGITGARLRALLSQPTPSAEPDRVFRCDDCGDEFDDDHYGDAQVHADRHSHNVPSWTIPSWDTPAAPPSIADLAPGTTFTAGLNEDWSSRPHRQWTVRSGDVVWCASEGFGVRTGRIDPSTIRDVTPPKEQP